VVDHGYPGSCIRQCFHKQDSPLAVASLDARLLGCFFWFEFEQTRLRHKFGQRCIWIESAITRVLRTVASRTGDVLVRDSFVKLRFVPGILTTCAKDGGRLIKRSGRPCGRSGRPTFFFMRHWFFSHCSLHSGIRKRQKQEIKQDDRPPGDVIIYNRQSEQIRPPLPAGVGHQSAVSGSKDRDEAKEKKNK